jgi:TonB family protein
MIMKRLISLATGLLFLSVAFISSGFAQEAPKAIKGGLLNGRAISLPAPVYPEAAKLENAGGRVSVTVLVDEEGNVIEAKAAAEYAVTGDDGSATETKQIHPALREAAEKAAWSAKFSPAKLSGQPVRVSGTITYNFVPGGSDRVPNGLRVSGGILNGKAASLPKPVYPSAAAEANVTGVANVQIVIDEAGNVISADAVSGHPLLRSAAVDAAREAKFAPTVLSGQPVKVTGVLAYSFKAGEWYTGKPAPETPVTGGVLNGKAASLPIPAYPEAAKAARAGGAVSVQVTIDEQGNVVSANAVSGHPLLRAAAVDAAREAKFSPTLLEGKPVTVSGVLVYNFVP